MTKARFYRFFLHQTQSKSDGNVHEKVWRTLFTLSPPLGVLVRPVRRLGRWAVCASGKLATHEHPQIPIPLCCPRHSGSPQTRTDSVQTHLVSLIHNSQWSKSWSSSHRCRYKSASFLRYVLDLSFAVIGSGAHVAVVAPVDNARGICKAFMK